MKKTVLMAILALLAVRLWAQSGTIVFMDGQVDYRNSAGELMTADIGTVLRPGDNILTGADGYAEVTLDNDSLITINSDTVFTFNEVEDREEPGKKRGMFGTIIGAVSFRFKKFTGNEPYIQTPSTVCGVRGTEFTVFAGEDGSAQYAVADGEVAVNSEGVEVALLPDEGVNVVMGQAPGSKFEVKDGYIDFETQAAAAQQRMEADPAAIFDDVYARFEELADETDGWDQEIENAGTKIEEQKTIARDIYDSEGNDPYQTYYKANVQPLEIGQFALGLNRRFTAVSVLSLRRHLVSRIYLKMKTKYILDQENPEYLDFLETYYMFIEEYEQRMYSTDYLSEETDI